MIYKIEVFIPEEHTEALRKAVNEAGACKVGNYDNVFSYSTIKGFWRPLPGSSPVTGEKDKINFGSEVKTEFLCPEENIEKVLSAIMNVHPYEEPVVNIIQTANHIFKK